MAQLVSVVSRSLSNSEVYRREADGVRSRTTAVAVFCYNRPGALHQLFSTLVPQLCGTEISVWVFRDGPRTPEDLKSQERIDELVFRDLAEVPYTYVRRSSNHGLGESIIRGVTQVSKRVNRVIVLEDDLVLHPGAIRYFVTHLDSCERSPDVFSISGYVDPVTERSLGGDAEAEFLCTRPTTWGWATWSDVWRACPWDREHYERLRSDGPSMAKIRRLGADVVPWLDGYLRGEIDSWGIRWTAYHAVNQGLAVYPARTRVHNEGMGLHATNTLFSLSTMPHLRGRRPAHWLPASGSYSRYARAANCHYLRQFHTTAFRWRVALRSFRAFVWLKRCLIRLLTLVRPQQTSAPGGTANS